MWMVDGTTLDSNLSDGTPPQGPLQDAWVREVQRRHMRAINGGSARAARGGAARDSGAGSHGVPDWRQFEGALQVRQRRFADFSRFGFGVGEVPDLVTNDRTHALESGARSGAGGAVIRITDAEWRKLPECLAAAVAGTAECAICLAQLSPESRLRLMPCGHGFHATCLWRWLQRSRSCPCCRAPLPRRAAAPTARPTAGSSASRSTPLPVPAAASGSGSGTARRSAGAGGGLPRPRGGRRLSELRNELP